MGRAQADKTIALRGLREKHLSYTILFLLCKKEVSMNRIRNLLVTKKQHFHPIRLTLNVISCTRLKNFFCKNTNRYFQGAKL